jgi:hypothetical protein
MSDRVGVIPNPSIRFVGEQDGPSEHDFKRDISILLGTRKDVRSAYLAIADYSDGLPLKVVLCLRLEKGEDKKLLRQVNKIFAKMFSHTESLDVLFLDEAEESCLKRICLPFYQT